MNGSIAHVEIQKNQWVVHLLMQVHRSDLEQLGI